MWARRCVRLLEAVGTAHPCLVSVMVTAIHQYLDDADQLDPDGVRGAALASVGTGLTPQQWRGELDRLVADMSRGEPADVVLRHRLLLERMHALMPNGMAYPPHTEAYVISPEMHNVVRAAAMTVTEDDLFTLDPDTDLPTPAGVLLLPQVCGSGSARYAPVSVIGWRPQTGRVLPGSAAVTGVWVEGMSQRRDIDQLDMWAFAVAASRTARVRPPLALPFSNTWLVSGSNLADPERAAMARAVRVNALIKDQRGADSAEYDPAAVDTDFGLGAYAFAFWRLCRQPISTVDLIAAGAGDVHRSGDRGGRRDEPGPAAPLDRVRVVQLRAPHHPDTNDGAAAHGPRYHHRWPVRMHKVRQYYPSLGSHKVIWRGPYIKGPDGAPLLIGPKAQAVTA